jgi:hypothetical protein
MVDQTEPVPGTPEVSVAAYDDDRLEDTHGVYEDTPDLLRSLPANGRQTILIQDLERLRSANATWIEVRARISFEEPKDLQFLYQATEVKEWLTSIATSSDLIDTIERIGGPLPLQMEWLDAAGVKRAPANARRAPLLSANDDAFLEHFDRYRTLALIEEEIDRAQQQATQYLRWTPAMGQHPEAARFHRNTLRPLEERRLIALSEAGLSEESWAQTKASFQGLFHAHALRTAHAMLKDSARVVEAERTRYRAPTELEALRRDIAPLVEKEREVVRLTRSYAAEARRELNVKGISETADGLTRAEAALKTLRAEIAQSKNYPILLEPTLDLEALAAGPREARAEIDRAAAARLADVEAMHQHLDDDTSLVFRLDRVVEAAKDSMGLVAGSAGESLVRAETTRREETNTRWNAAVAAVAVALGLLTGVGGAFGLAASTLGTSLGVMSSLDSLAQYRIDSHASATSFDRARALSSEDPSAFWLAIDIAGTVLDVGAFAKTFTRLHEAASSAVHAGSAAELERARGTIAQVAGQAPHGSIAQSDQLASFAIESVERERARFALIDSNPSLVRALRSRHPELDRPALAGLLQLDEGARTRVLNALADKPMQLARLGHVLDSSDAAVRGVEQLARVLDADRLGDLAVEISAWRNPERARRMLASLGDARVTDADKAELVHVLASRTSPSAKADLLDAFARERLPVLRSDAEAFARRNGVPIVINETGASREVRVHFVAREGLVDDIRLEIGARTTLSDLELHQSVVQKIARYRGLLGRASRIIDRFKQAGGGVGAGPGRLAFEAKREVEKLPAIIRAFERELAGSVTPERIALLDRDIAALESQLDGFRRVLGDEIDEPGRGFISALDASACEADRVRALEEGWPKYPVVADLEGKTLEQVKSDPNLKRTFEEHYHSSPQPPASEKAPVVWRNNGTTDEVPLLRVENERLRFVPAGHVAPPILLPRGAATAEIAAFLERNSQSWTKWRSALVSQGVMTEGELSELVQKTMSRKNAPATVQGLRDALKAATRDRLVAHCFDGVSEGAASHARLRAFVFDLNPADQGSITERWYIEHSRRYRGVELQSQPELWTGPADARVKLNRRPDNLHVAGNELGEVKSTANGLRSRDIDQIDDTLNAIEGRGGVVAAGRSQTIGKYRLTFTDARGAAASADVIHRWLRSSRSLTIDVFDTRGVLHNLSRNDLSRLETLLQLWATP